MRPDAHIAIYHDHSRHRPWQRWKLTRRVAQLLFAARIFTAIGSSDGDGCRMCLTYVRIGKWVWER